ncbi:MAG TPA: hypothetical protein VFQ91_25050 [Bryobacteraceae bacterium]|nr:hypothetical protein [Bryobacteraceae bacterium]
MGTSAAKPAWIISQREDLTWFIGSSLAGYLALSLFASGFPVFPLQLLWMLGIDGPHVVATVTRTYLDREARRALGPALWAIVPFSLIGPAAGLAGQLPLFFLFAVSWQHLHIVKQHYGFVMLYKAKNKERDRRDLRLDRWFLLSSMWTPFLGFVVATRPWFGVWGDTIWSGVLALYLTLAVVWIARQAQKMVQKVPLNVPKMALFGVILPLQWLSFHHAAAYGPDGVLRAGIILGLFHSLQYHRLLWFHNRNRYRTPGALERNGLAAVLANSVWGYLAVAIGLNLVLSVLPVAFAPWRDMAVAATWGLAFTHYFLDSKIWRVQGNQELASALRL